MASEIQDTAKLCIHSITTKPWEIETAAPRYAEAGVKGITVWRNALEGRNVEKTGQMIRSQGLEIISLCRGGFFPNREKQKRKEAIEENKKIIEEAAALGTPMVVLVCGADPKQSLEVSRKQIQEGIVETLDHAGKHNVKLAIEPLHPMYADTRSAINTLKQANDMAERIQSPHVGVAVDVYHLWWDEALKEEITRCGSNDNLFAFHVCDWKVPTNDFLLDRGLMGEGCIDIPQIREWVGNTGFNGMSEVEIFSSNYWAMDQDEYLDKIVKAYLEYV
ncbi:MAG: sugar phosphate isomerase/epimerase [Bacteroidales bacterium]|nr:sugar phosphate isomerase/epimerase [Bacteroidales bacterium]